MIVMVVATVILMIVFMVVPKLNRDKRNHKRTSEASLIAAAVNECLSGHNFVYSSCGVADLSGADSYVDIGSFQELTTLSVEPYGATVSDTQTAYIVYDYACNSTNEGLDSTPKPRSFAVLWKNEVDVNRCLAS